MKILLRLLGVALLGLGVVATSSAAGTDGTATVTVSFADPSGGYSARVDAFWVTDGAGNFVQNVRKDAASRQRYLYKWTNMSHSYTTIDGYSGASSSGTTPVTVTWDCRDINNVIVPDGTYKFYIEFTDRNSQGPWTTNGLAFTKGALPLTNTYSGQQYMSGLTVTYLPLHDIAVARMSPVAAQPNSLVSVQVVVTNLTGSPEANVAVTLSNQTSASLVGTQLIASLAGTAATTLTFPWSTTNLALGTYTLVARAVPVAGETVVANNVLNNPITIQSTMHDLAVLRMSPSNGFASSNVIVQVLVTNETATPETFSVLLSNLTTSSLIASQRISNLAGNGASNVSFNWSTMAVGPGPYLIQANAGPVESEVAVSDNYFTNTITLRNLFHELAILRYTAPFVAISNSTTNLTFFVTNVGDYTETFSVRLYDDTDGRLLGSRQVTFPTHLGNNQTLTWAVTNTPLGYHPLRAVVGPAANEANLADNTLSFVVPVALGGTTNTLLATGESWKYNDTGLDLTETPWRAPNYYDAVWPAGPAPLGYGYPSIVTTNQYGPNHTDKYPTYYYRRSFISDVVPGGAWVRFRRDDGLVVYLNGLEVARQNLAAGPVRFASRALTNSSGFGDFWITNTVAASNVVAGLNQLAVEVHQFSSNSPDLLFDLGFVAVLPTFPQEHAVDTLAISTPTDALVGDKLSLSVSVTNRGTVPETVQVVLLDQLSGQILGAQTLFGVVPGQAPAVRFDWATLGASNGTHPLQAYTVVGGVTNWAGAVSGSVVLSGSGFGLNAVNAVGTLGGRCSAVALAGSQLLVGAGAALEVWDRSNPSAPVRLGAVRLPGLVEGLAARGSYAYVACGPAGVQFVDLSSPAQPVHLNTYNTSGHAYGVALDGDFLYIADGVAGLRVVNIANPAAPFLAGAYYTGGPARAVVAAAGTAYLLDQHDGLLVLNVANPGAISLLGSYGGIGAGQALAVADGQAYVVDGNNHFVVVNVSAPAAPTLTGSLLLPNVIGQALLLNGTTAYVAAGEAGLVIVNVSAPATPVLLSTVPVPGQAVGLALAAGRLYLADGLAGFQILDATAPATPTLVADLPTALRASDVVVAANVAYVAGGETGLRLYSLSNASAPVLLSQFSGTANARCVAVAGSTAYVGDGQYGLKIVNVADPRAPVLLGSFSSPALASIRSVGVSGSLVVVSDGRTVMLVDAATPAAPALVGTYNTPGFAFGLAVANAKAYLACGNSGLIILNLAAGGLSQAGAYDAGGLVVGVSVVGTKAYLAKGVGGWMALDVSNPASPSLLGASADQGPAFGIVATDTITALANGANAVLTLDLSAPLHPVARASFGPLVRAVRLAAAPALLLTAEDEAGVAILGAGADADQDGLPDAWEQQIIAASEAAGGSIHTIADVRPGDDFDGDGLSNYAEYLAGTSPTDPNSRLMLFVPVAGSGQQVTIRWTSVPGKTYTVWKSPNLGAPNSFTILQDNVPGNSADTTSITDSAATGHAFYMISVR